MSQQFNGGGSGKTSAMLVHRGRRYLRTSGDGNNRTARPVPGQEMCRPGEKRRKVTNSRKNQHKVFYKYCSSQVQGSLAYNSMNTFILKDAPHLLND